MFQKIKENLNDLKEKYLKFLVLIFLLILTIFLWANVIWFSNKNLKIAFMDIGQGDAIFIKSPDGNKIIVDGGPGESLMKILPKQLSFFDKDIDMIVITNPDKDHFEGFIPLLQRYYVPVVLTSGIRPLDNQVYLQFLKLAEDKKVKEVVANKGQIISIGGGAFMEVIFPDRDVSALSHNDGSVVIKLIYKDISILLTGDTTEKMEKYFTAYNFDLKSDVLKVAHHGSKTSTSEDFLKKVSPKIAIISAGIGNSYGHPHKEVLDRLENAKIKVFGTYEFGSIALESDGDSIWMD